MQNREAQATEERLEAYFAENPDERIEEHPWKVYIPQQCERLIIGTFPSAEKNWAYPFFYPNPHNLFWRILAQIAKQTLTHNAGAAAVAERRALLDKLHTGISDMGHTVIRKHNSSLDENLECTVYMDIFKIIEAHPQITKIIFTSSSGKVSALAWFKKYLKQQHIHHKFPSGAKPLRSLLRYKQRDLELVILYSPSPRAANRISFEQLTALYRQEILP